MDYQCFAEKLLHCVKIASMGGFERLRSSAGENKNYKKGVWNILFSADLLEEGGKRTLVTAVVEMGQEKQSLNKRRRAAASPSHDSCAED